MCEIQIDTLSKIIASIGLLLDIVGAWLVAWEVTNQFKGHRSSVSGGFINNKLGDIRPNKSISGQTVHDTMSFVAWESLKLHRMKIGIYIITIGFALQIASLWIYPGQNNEKPNITREINNKESPVINIGKESKPPPKIVTKPLNTKPLPAK